MGPNNELTLFPIAILWWLPSAFEADEARISWIRYFAVYARARAIWEEHVEHANLVHFAGRGSREDVEDFLHRDPRWHSSAEECGLAHYRTEEDVFAWLWKLCKQSPVEAGLYERIRAVYETIAHSQVPDAPESMRVGVALRTLFWDLTWTDLVVFCAIAAGLGKSRIKILRRDWLRVLAAGYNKASDVPEGLTLLHVNTISAAAERLKESGLIHKQYDSVGRRDTWYALFWRVSEESFQNYVQDRVANKSTTRIRKRRERKQSSKDWAETVKADIARRVNL